ncbi:hypothetical protein Poli38472_002445 [Pythium oligandrum]|uniref:Uncharacterized protein n=1 Tax=Pythium oligandrum TaxID=41045 RepID=A0A8K1CH70_PYTOL|nr:hypothetical protein Poli38472_002445 [Pythium oligandrum]|eukprot:TMW63504.1 hypothetical protein Poli38472_002445 [Pythium oligandrum]
MGISEFNFNNNPDLHAFPESGMKTPLRVVSIENTAFSELPAWVNSADMTGPWGGLAIYANNTPLCQAMDGVSPDDLRYTSTLIASATSTLVFCSQRDPNGLRRVPMDALIARFRPSA